MEINNINNKDNIGSLNERISNENISNLKNNIIGAILNINFPSEYLKITDSLWRLNNNIGNTCYINEALRS